MSTTKLFASIPALRSSIQKDIETYELPIEKNGSVDFSWG